MHKMVQPSHWFIQFILLCQLWQLGAPCFGRLEHSSMGIYQESGLISKENISKIIFFGIFVLIAKKGKQLEKGYRCPTYCKTDHKHIYWKEEVSHVDTLKNVKKVLAYNP